MTRTAWSNAGGKSRSGGTFKFANEDPPHSHRTQPRGQSGQDGGLKYSRRDLESWTVPDGEESTPGGHEAGRR